MESEPDVVRLEALAAFDAGDFVGALDRLDSLVVATDHDADHRWRGQALLRLGNYAQAYKAFELVYSRCPDDPRVLSVMAAIKSSCPDSSMRDGGAALMLAQRARNMMTVTNWSNESCLAAAYAELGDFGNAVFHIEEALSNAPPDLKERFEQRLEQYRCREPYRLLPGGFDGLTPAAKCERCGADSFCSDYYPPTERTVICLECARQEFGRDTKRP